MKKLIICLTSLVILCLCFVSYAASQDIGKESQVTPVEEYQVDYVYCLCLNTTAVMDYREPYGIYEDEKLETVVYGENGEELSEGFSALDFDAETSEMEYVDALYGQFEAYLPEELAFSDFVVSVKALVTTQFGSDSYTHFVSYGDIGSVDSVSYSFSFTLAIDEMPTNASATVEIRNGRVVSISIGNMERFLPYLNLELDGERLQTVISGTDSTWYKYGDYTVTRDAALATSEDALYLVIDTEILDNGPYEEGWYEEFDSAYPEPKRVYYSTRTHMLRRYYVKLATIN